MKRFLLCVLILSLLLLSGCYYKYTQDDMDELADKKDEEYYKMEELFMSSYKEAENLSNAISSTEDYMYVLICYFDEHDGTTFDQAYDAFDNLHTILSAYY